MWKEKEREESSPVGSPLAWMLRQNRQGNKRKHGQTFADAHCDFFPHDWSCNIAGCCRATGQMVPLRREVEMQQGLRFVRVCACNNSICKFLDGFFCDNWKGCDWMINNCIMLSAFVKKKKKKEDISGHQAAVFSIRIMWRNANQQPLLKNCQRIAEFF